MDFLTPVHLKLLATIFNLMASIILAFRVTIILSALAFVADMHEHSINELSKTSGNIVIPTGSNNHVKKAKGKILLITGFLFYVIAAILNLFALVIAR